MKQKRATVSKKESSDAPQKDKKQTTVTCMHCRYEYAADAPRCTICGYPWPWLK